MNFKKLFYLVPLLAVLFFPFYLKQLHDNFYWVKGDDTKVFLCFVTLVLIGGFGTIIAREMID